MEFAILGPLEAREGQEAVQLGAPKQRTVLGLLLLHSNEVVSIARLVDELWGERPPPTAEKLVQGYVHALRKALGGGLVQTRAPGYRLVLDDRSLDLGEFERLVEEARSAPLSQAVELRRRALGLWRGAPLEDVVFEGSARIEVARLGELRLATQIDQVDAQLELGRHADVIGELEEVVAEHPYAERPHAQLMLALYRSGRQAEALDVYRRFRRALAEELGLQPTRELRELEQAILRQDESLSVVTTPAPSTTVGVAREESSSRGHRRVALVVVLVLGVAALAAALALRPSHSGLVLEPRSLGRIDARTNAVVGEVPLGSRPGAITASVRMVWVAGREGTLIRVDPVRMRVVRTLALGARPSDADLGWSALWVGDAQGEEVVRVDLAHDAVSGRVKLPAASGRTAVLGPVAPSLAFGAGSLWVSRGQESVLRIDPRTYAVRAEILPEHGANTALAFGEGALWVGGWNAVSRISPATGRVTSAIRLDATPVSLAVGGGSIWASLPAAGKVVRIDVETESVEAIAVDGAPAALASGADGVWVAVPSQGAVLRLDPTSGEVVARIPTGATPTALAATGDSVWVTVI
jgi:DNA-binding SARP family transcriptional activator